MKTTAVEDGIEKAFLAEMLKYAGPQPLSGEFGGGIGEDQFSSMMTDVHATAIAARIDLGLLRKTGEGA
ncbi:hypothetical protein [Paracoccus broussonetiae]